MTSSSSAADIDLETVDLMDVSLFSDGPPHELFARMRAEAPVRWNPMANGDGLRKRPCCTGCYAITSSAPEAAQVEA